MKDSILQATPRDQIDLFDMYPTIFRINFDPFDDSFAH